MSKGQDPEERNRIVARDHRCSFTMVPNTVLRSGLDPYAIRVYLHYASLANMHGGFIEQSTREIADQTGISVGQVCRSRQRLTDAGWLTVELRPGNHQTADITLVDRWRDNCTCSVHVVNADSSSVHTVNSSVHTVNAVNLIPERLKKDSFALARGREGTPSPKPNGSPLGRIIDAIRARGGTVTVTSRDGATLKACAPAPDPEMVADAFLSAEQWGGAWLAENLCVRLVLEHLSAYQAWVTGGRKPRGNGNGNGNGRYQRPDYGDRHAPPPEGPDPRTNYAFRRDPEYVARWNREHPDKAWHPETERLRG